MTIDFVKERFNHLPEKLAQNKIPLKTNADGKILVGETCVTLDKVVAMFNQGSTPEEIKVCYSTLKLADIYAAIGFHLTYQEEVKADLKQHQQPTPEVYTMNYAVSSDILTTPKIDWAKISSEDDIHKLKDSLGSFLAIKQKLSNDLSIKLNARSYTDLYKCLKQFQIIFGEPYHKHSEDEDIDQLKATPSDKPIHKDAHFFASEQHRLTYALTRLEGAQRMDMLGITDQHWKDLNYIKTWFRKLSKVIHPDYNKIPESNLAWQNLDKIKEDLIKHVEKFVSHNK